ncbi:MAG: L-threonylcarbamoyladenylate synthase [Candidatus Jacksonbacteria bacterium]
MRILKQIPPLEILRTSVFVYPTETCYGLGCDALQPDLVKRIYQIKGRDFKKPVSWIVADIKMAKRYVKFSAKALNLAQKYWPGPLTLVLPSKRSSRLIALRVSSYPIAWQISKILNRPIIATSANVSGALNCYSAQETAKQFKNQEEKPDFIIDGGVLLNHLPTTTVQITGNQIKVLRQGGIAFKS